MSWHERDHLRAWQEAARTIGIDAVEDLASRPWPYPISGSVIGVFQAGDAAATWMVIGHNGAWAVASCATGIVSSTYNSLAEALTVIYPANGVSRLPEVPSAPGSA